MTWPVIPPQACESDPSIPLTHTFTPPFEPPFTPLSPLSPLPPRHVHDGRRARPLHPLRDPWLHCHRHLRRQHHGRLPGRGSRRWGRQISKSPNLQIIPPSESSKSPISKSSEHANHHYIRVGEGAPHPPTCCARVSTRLLTTIWLLTSRPTTNCQLLTTTLLTTNYLLLTTNY